MQKWIISEFLKPLIRRAGTALGALLVGYGVATDEANVIVYGATAALSVAVDLVSSHLDRKKK